MIKIEAKDSKNSTGNLEYVEPEIWKDIEGYESKYKVSNKGRVRSIDRVVEIKGHPTLDKRTVPGKVLKMAKIHGYNCVRLCKNGIVKNYRVARLVAKAFVPNPKNKPQVNHIDGNKINDTPSNLEWSTASENIQHAYDSGLIPKRLGEDHPLSLLTKEDVCSIREEYKSDNETQYTLAEKYGVARKTIADILNNKTWNHV